MPEDPGSPTPTPTPAPANSTSVAWGSDVSKPRLLVAGFFGGLATPLIRPVQEFLVTHRYPSDIGTVYWVTGVLLGIAGALLVWIFRETDARKALILGLSVPAFLTSLGGAVQNTGDKPVSPPSPKVEEEAAAIEKNGGLGGIPFFGASAYAAAPAIPVNVPDRTVEIAAVDQPFAYRADLIDANNQIVTSFAVLEKNSPLVVRPLPPAAAAIRFTIGSSTSAAYPLGGKPGDTVGIALRATIQRKIGIAQAFGKTPDLEAKITADVEARPKAPARLRGWIFLGNHDSSGWGLQTVDTGEAIPKKDEVVKIIAPVNVRDAARSKQPRKGIISTGQRVCLLSDPQGPGALWAEIEVQPDASPDLN